MWSNNEQQTDLSVWSTERVKEWYHRYTSGEQMNDSPWYNNMIGIRRANIVFAFTPEELSEFTLCANNPNYFAKYCEIMQGTKGYKPVDLRDYQKRLLNNYYKERFNIVLSCRQAGKTVTSSIFLLHQACFNTDRNIGVAANKARTATEILDKIKQILFRMPFFLTPGVKSISNEAITFENGCKIICQATTPRSFIGYTIHTLYLDEFAHVEPHILNQFYENIVPTVSSMDDSKIIVTSTPNGHNKYYEMVEGAKNGTNGYTYNRVDWWEIPGHDEKWKDDQIKLLGEDEFLRQYGNVFTMTGSLLLSPTVLEQFNKSEEDYSYCDIDILERNYKDDWKYLTFKKSFDIENLRDNNRRFLISCDLAEGGGRNADYTVFQILEINLKDDITGITDKKELSVFTQVGIFRSNCTTIDTAAELLYRLAVQVIGIDNCRLIIEANTYGSLFINNLLAIDGYNNEFDKSCICRFVKNQLTGTETYGLTLNNQNKNAYCIRFRGMCANKQYIISEKNTIQESECFSKVGNSYKANGSFGGHDDTIMSLIDSSAFVDTDSYTQFVDELLEIEDKYDLYENSLDVTSGESPLITLKSKRHNNLINFDNW